MANKKKLADKKAAHKPALLEETARTIGAALGTAALKAGLAVKHEVGARIINGRFQKSDKSRLPRKLKKQHQKAA
jgi:hypothetical protein